MKLTLYHRTEILRALIYRRLIHRTEPNRPHISSDISISNSVETKQNQMRPKVLGAPRLQYLCFFFRVSLPYLPRFRFRPARLAPRWCIAAPPVKRLLRRVTDTRNPFFQEICIFHDNPDFFRFLLELCGHFNARTLGHIAILLGGIETEHTRFGVIHRGPPQEPCNSASVWQPNHSESADSHFVNEIIVFSGSDSLRSPPQNTKTRQFYAAEFSETAASKVL